MRGLILDNFGFQPTPEQEKAVEMMADFFFEQDSNSLFLLRGYAGTGKTSIVSALIRSLDQLKQKTVLMAPTGRAAKVFSLYSNHSAYTIHKRIYRQKEFTGDMSGFMQNINLLKHTLFVVDEASMISNDGLVGNVFGTGRLLDDLIQFVYSGEGCRLMLIGDSAQLPPVGEEQSPALDIMALEGYGLSVKEITLTHVVRQLSESGILWNATNLRQLIVNEEFWNFPQLHINGFADVVYIPGQELIEALEQAYYQCGADQTIIITRSNARANIYNRGIRARVLDYDSELVAGDHVMVVKNNYHWVKPQVAEDSDTTQMDFIANGDVAIVRRYHHEREEYGFRFVDATLTFPDYDSMEVDATLLLDTLSSDAPALLKSQQDALFQGVWDDYPELLNKRDRMKAVKEDPYYNALQVKFAYAVTCHKAQGGQWQRVFIDQGYINDDMLSPDYFRWLYTAITRATETVYLVNWPQDQIDKTIQI